jgi:hypothetical protein
LVAVAVASALLTAYSLDVERLAAGSHDGTELAVQAPEEQACITGQHGFFLVVIEEVESLDDRS